MVNTALSRDEIPDELLIVPTIHEAEDLIDMEEIERDLGFNWTSYLCIAVSFSTIANYKFPRSNWKL